MRQRNKITAILAFSALALGLSSLSGTSSAAGSSGRSSAAAASSAANGQFPEKGRGLANAAAAAGALGISRAADGSALVRMPRGSSARVSIPSDESRARSVVSQFGRQDVDTLMAEIALRNWTPDAKSFNYAFSYSAESDTIEITTNADASNQAAMRAKFGNRITLKVGSGPKRRSGQRNADNNSPHYGAAYIRQGDSILVAYCTSAFVIKVGTQLRQLTANHCFRNTQGTYGPDVYVANSPYYYGTLQTAPSFPTYEFRSMNITNCYCTYAGRIYVGSATSSSTAPVHSAAPPCVGCSPYYYSGGSSGEHGGGTVTSTSASFCDASGCTYYLVKVSGQALTKGGDSGAPMYAKGTDGSVSVRGVAVGDDGSYNYYENWSTISNYYGATIVTG